MAVESDRVEQQSEGQREVEMQLEQEQEQMPKKQQQQRPKLGGKRSSSMNSPVYMQTGDRNVVLVRRLKRKDAGAWRHLARWFVQNQIGLSFNLLALLFLAQLFIPRARVYTRKFFSLAYYNPTTGKYGAGSDDAYFICFGVILYTGLRAFVMDYLLAPVARSQGVHKPKDLTRFTEQAWLLVYYLIFWPLGVYIYVNSDYYLSLKGLWTNWPDRELPAINKVYLLAQWAFWVQQIVVIHIEERRKDHYQMLTHHFITISLISSCYSYHHTKVGTLILVLMDVVDIFLPLAKCLKYAGMNKLCDAAFVVFMLSWLLARHIFYIMVCWSIYADTPEILTTGCFSGTSNNLEGPKPTPPGYGYLLEPFLNSKGNVCYNETVKWAFLGPLLALQVITIAWFFLIIRVAIKVLSGGGAEDSRSDDEGEDGAEDEEEEFVYEEVRPLEEEVGVEELDLRNWERRSGVKRQASASGVSLPGHSDRKELLGRIGCEKQVD